MVIKIFWNLGASGSYQHIGGWEESFDPQFRTAAHEFWPRQPAMHNWLSDLRTLSHF
jgi:hypothetical protein